MCDTLEDALLAASEIFAVTLQINSLHQVYIEASNVHSFRQLASACRDKDDAGVRHEYHVLISFILKCKLFPPKIVVR